MNDIPKPPGALLSRPPIVVGTSKRVELPGMLPASVDPNIVVGLRASNDATGPCVWIHTSASFSFAVFPTAEQSVSGLYAAVTEALGRGE